MRVYKQKLMHLLVAIFVITSTIRSLHFAVNVGDVVFVPTGKVGIVCYKVDSITAVVYACRNDETDCKSTIKRKLENSQCWLEKAGRKLLVVTVLADTADEKGNTIIEVVGEEGERGYSYSAFYHIYAYR